MPAVKTLARHVRSLRGWWSRFVRDSIINALVARSFLPHPIRLAVLRAWGLEVGACRVEPGCWFGAPTIRIGDNCIVGRACVFDTLASITLDDGAQLGMNVLFVTSSHVIGDASQRVGSLAPEPITVGRGAWIGSNVTLLPGSVIGEGCVITAGAVVSGKCEPNGVYAGNPGRRVRSLTD